MAPLVHRDLRDAIAAVAKAHPMEWMHPSIENGEQDHRGDNMNPDNAAPCHLAGSLRRDKVDQEFAKVDEGKHRPEGEIGDHHRAEKTAHSNWVAQCREGKKAGYGKQYDRTDIDPFFLVV